MTHVMNVLVWSQRHQSSEKEVSSKYLVILQLLESSRACLSIPQVLDVGCVSAHTSW